MSKRVVTVPKGRTPTAVSLEACREYHRFDFTDNTVIVVWMIDATQLWITSIRALESDYPSSYCMVCRLSNMS